MRWKLIGAAFAAVIVIFIVAIYAVLSSYDYNKLKPLMERKAFESTGRELKFGGDIDLKVGLTPTLVLQEVSLQNAQWGSGPDLLNVKRFEVQVALLPLLGGNIEIKRAVLIDPEILIETDASGRSNLEFTPPITAEAKAPVKPAPPSDDELKLPDLAIGDIRIENGLVTYIDGKTKETQTFDISRMTAKMASPKSPIKIALKGKYEGTPLELTTEVDPLEVLSRATKDSTVAFKLTALDLTFGKSDISGAVSINLSGARPVITAELTS